MGGVSANSPDSIMIKYSYCADGITTVVRSHTYIYNEFKCGNYTYTIESNEIKDATVTLNAKLPLYYQTHHNLIFNCSIHYIAKINLHIKYTKYNTTTTVVRFKLNNDDNSKFSLKVKYSNLNNDIYILRNSVHYIFKD